MTLKEDIIALQERCKKELGVDVTIWINADNISQTVDQQNAERIAEMIVSAFDGTAKHVNQGDYNWIDIKSDKRFHCSIFYDSELEKAANQ